MALHPQEHLRQRNLEVVHHPVELLGHELRPEVLVQPARDVGVLAGVVGQAVEGHAPEVPRVQTVEELLVRNGAQPSSSSASTSMLC